MRCDTGRSGIVTASAASSPADVRRLEHEVADALRGGRIKDAARNAEHLTQTAPENPAGWLLLTHAKRALGDHAGMVDTARRAVACAPDDLSIALFLAETLVQAGRIKDVRTQLESLRSRAGSNARALAKISEIHTHCGDFEKAENAAAEACAAARGDPALLYNLAAARTSAGMLQQAEADFDRLIAQNPHDYDAYYNRSTLRRQTADDNHVGEIERALNAPLRNAMGAVSLNYALAKEYEDLGRWRESFDALERGAAARRALLSYRVDDDIEAMAAIARVFTADLLADAPPVSDAPGPIFILGLPRTGTTLVDRMLSAHGEVDSIGEVDDFPLVLSAATSGASSKEDRIARAGRIDFRALGAAYEARARQRCAAPFFVDKTPSNFLYLGLIALALPNARIIHLRRHPLAAGHAIFKTLFRMGYPYSYDQGDIGRYIAVYQKLMAHWREALPGRFIDLDYEALVADPETVSQQLVAECGLTWDEAVLDYRTQSSSAAATASAAQVREAVHTRSVALWRHYEARLAPMRDALLAAGGEIPE